MNYLSNYLQTIRKRGSIELAESIQQTVNGIVPQYLEDFSFCDHEIGLLFGNVQSGKTGQMFGVISAAADIGFPVFLILTTNNITLQQQTIDRVRADLKDFCICDEYDTEIFTENCLMEPTVIVLKKEVNVLKQWSNIIASTGFMRGNPLFIVDDEADAASLNTLVNRNRHSSINKYLNEIKNRSACSIYLQVTGTPQALLLQSISSGWHPYFTYYFKPGKGYLGGDFFFPKEGMNPSITYIDDIKEPLRDAVLHHLVVSSQLLGSGKKVCNCLIHPSVRKATHAAFQREVQKELKYFLSIADSPEFEKCISEQYSLLKPEKTSLLHFNEIFSGVKKILKDGNIEVLVMNANSGVASEEYEAGSNIIIGGNTLGRGVTFSGLQTIYYTRTAKKPQADTMWQHSRMFGYDRDPGMMKVFVQKNLYKLFSDINATNNSIIAQVEKGIEQIKIFYPDGLNPTRKNVLDNKKVFIISGGTNYYPFDPDNDTIEQIDKLLISFDDQTLSYQVSLRLMKEIFSHVLSASDFDVKSFTSILDSMLAEKPVCQGILIVRRNRNVSKGTGALLSANDWQLGTSITNQVVLTMYQMTGEKGWNGKKVWVPNIKLPDNIMYYDVKDEEVDG